MSVNIQLFLTAGSVILLTSFVNVSTSFGLQQHTDINGPFYSIAAVNTNCLSCHPGQGEVLNSSVHSAWTPSKKDSPSGTAITANLSRFGIAMEANRKICRRCHSSIPPDDKSEKNTILSPGNCLLCHNTTGRSVNTLSPDSLLHAARTVGKPTAQNCRLCHDNQCGLIPNKKLLPPFDVHIDRYGFTCQRCHSSAGGHNFQRKRTASTPEDVNTGCGSCHTMRPHDLSRLNQHATLIGCQTCHIPEYGRIQPRVISWNWLLSEEIITTYQQGNKILTQGGFTLAQYVTPLYSWDNGAKVVYARGGKIQPSQTTVLQGPEPRTPESRIMPFSVQYGVQLYDRKYRYLISPQLPLEHAPFFTSSWETTIREGMHKVKLPYSGQYGCITTVSFTRINHGVVPANQALDCMDCHNKGQTFDWQRLGYEKDPWSRKQKPESINLPKKLPTITLPPIQESILPTVPPL